jgi:peptidoglycan/LPS O-acetylase OafA/YrhL
MGHLKYRPEIDGLRALAVIPVILFHGGLKLFSGGFIGVDVFFVISGYLITSIILFEMEAGTFSLRRFYERRARRILPALFFVTICCVPFALVWMAPDQLRAFGKSVIAVTLFFSNVLFWLESGYFTPAADQKPLLHTWSLAIEEQYYLIFPILMIAVWRFGRARVSLIIFIWIVASFAVAQTGSRRWPEATFFLISSRSWELALGALAAIYMRSPLEINSKAREVLSAVGLCLIIYPIFTYSAKTPYPGFYALAPTLGTALIILFSERTRFVGGTLSLSPIVGVGLISYSAYLWHQPLFAFYRIVHGDSPSLAILLILIAICLLIAYVTWQYIEKPARFRAPRAPFIAVATTASVVIVGCGLFVASGTIGRKFSPVEISQMQPPTGNKDPRLAKCIQIARSDYGFRYCSEYPHLSRKAVLYGDSHAQALFFQLADALSVHGIDLVMLQDADKLRFGCQIMVGSFRASGQVSPQMRQWCEERTKEISRTANNFSAEFLFISLRYTFRLFPVPGQIDSLEFDNGEGGVGNESFREFFVFNSQNQPSFAAKDKFNVTTQSLRYLIDEFGGRVIFIGPVPEVGWHVGNRNRSRIVLYGEAEQTTSIDYSRFKIRNQFANSILHQVDGYKRALVIQPSNVFCNRLVADRCVAQAYGVPLYYDDDHLSNEGAKLLSEHVVHQMQARQALGQ